MIYLDTAAIVKLVRQEEHSGALVGWLNDHADAPLVASTLVEVEVPRALRRSAVAGLVGVPAVLGRLFRLEIDATVRAIAAAHPEPTLRSHDAIHLATAQLLASEAGAELVAFVTYDKRLRSRAADAGLPVAAPGEVA